MSRPQGDRFCNPFVQPEEDAAIRENDIGFGQNRHEALAVEKRLQRPRRMKGGEIASLFVDRQGSRSFTLGNPLLNLLLLRV
jgi:hypothetical protein